MPYSRQAKYRHYKNKDKSLFDESTYSVLKIEVAIARGYYRGDRFNKPGVKVTVGGLKKTKGTGKRGGWKYAIQKFMVPKEKYPKGL
jgi:hypothetical protein